MQSLGWGGTPLPSSGTFFHSHTAASGVDHQMFSYGWFWIRKIWHIGIDFLKWLMRDFCFFRSYNYIYKFRPFQAYGQSTSSSKCPLFGYNAASSWALKPVADSHGLLAVCCWRCFILIAQHQSLKTVQEYSSVRFLLSTWAVFAGCSHEKGHFVQPEEETRLQGDLIVTLQYLEGAYKTGGDRCFSRAWCARTKASGFKLKEGWYKK